MIQDIFPKVFHNEYVEKTPTDESVILAFNNDTVLVNNKDGEIEFPRKKEFEKAEGTYIYLFSIDSTEYFLADFENAGAMEDGLVASGYTYEPISALRYSLPKDRGVAGITAFHLYNWYRDNKFCGRCKGHMKPSQKERMLFCEQCNTMIYPKISPAMVVAIVDGNRLLMTKYAGREYTNYALIAGFAEIGESVEATVMRETLEEVGLKVKNITYFKSQPWAFSGSLLMGFFAELDGDDKITLDENELLEANWFSREEIQIEEDGISLTREMIHRFKTGNYHIENSLFPD